MITIRAPRRIWRQVVKFYVNATLKYKTYTITEAIADARKCMRGGLVSSSKRLSQWVAKNYVVFRSKDLGWYFACTLEKDVSYFVRDVENYRNMSDTAYHKGGSPTLSTDNPSLDTPLLTINTSRPIHYKSLPYKCNIIGSAGYDCRIIQRPDGKQTYIDKDGYLLNKNEWYEKVLPFKNSPIGVWGYVKCGTDCYAFLLDSKHAIDMHVKWDRRVCEHRITPCILDLLITESIREMCARKMLMESCSDDDTILIDEDDLRNMIRNVFARGRQFVNGNNRQDA